MKIFVTNYPSFYKIRLFNAVNKKEPIVAIFTGVKNFKNRNDDFFSGEMSFKHHSINDKGIQKYIRLYRFLAVHKAQCRELIIDGWDSWENWFIAYCFSKKQNGLIVESSLYESAVTGVKGLLKKLFLRRISTAYPCGITQRNLLERLGFKETIKITGGVGLMARQVQPPYEPRQKVTRFLYVGRLVAVKNLELLISVFNELPDLHLDIIGFGVLEAQLKALAGGNISFSGAIDNAALGHFYQVSDVFVLASTSETWGLVVEEALNNGCPVIVSDKVGCREDLVTEETGLVFKSGDKEDLKNAILKITDITIYNKLRLGVSKLDFAKREQEQINAYL